MAGIPPDELLHELREMTALLALSAAEQQDWLQRTGLPVDELALPLLDAVPAWFPRLSAAGLLNDAAEDALLALAGVLDGMRGRGRESLWRPEALESAAQWEEVRRLAAGALAELDSMGDGWVPGWLTDEVIDEV
jgi:hypothetical protein